MRADRLLMILSLLQTHGLRSSRELAMQLEVSDRTIHRDMEALSVAGIPVYAERGAKGGWALSEGYRNQLTGMTIDEIRSLVLLHSSSVVRDLGMQEHMKSAFRKLLTALPSAAQKDAEFTRQRIHVDGAAWHPSKPSSSNVSLLSIVQQAVWEQEELQITYSGWDTDSDKLSIVRPLGLVAKMSVWYMVAMTEDEIRTYRISRLKGATKTGKGFDRPEQFDLSAYWEESNVVFKSNLPTYPTHVNIASAMWSKFTQERYMSVQSSSIISEDGVEGEGEWVTAHVDFQTIENATRILLSYGRNAHALAPDQLRQAVYEESRAVVLYYKN